MRGFVYILRADIAGTIVFKIGRARRPPKRLSNIKLPFPFTVALCFPCKDCVAIERELHSEYASKRLDGEWFTLSDDDLVDIEWGQAMDGMLESLVATGHLKGATCPQ